MTINNVIDNTKKPNTKSSIIDDLKSMGIKRGDVIFVHSSMKEIGYTIGFTETLIEALMSVVGNEGTIIMPGHSGDNSNPEDWQNPPVPSEWWPILKDEIPAFDVFKTITRGVGKVPEHFRTFPNVLRSNHPQVSFLVWGQYSKYLAHNHPLEYGLNDDSPMGKLYDLNTKILMIGTDYTSCTALHLSEYRANYREEVILEAAIKDNGVRQWVKYKDIDLDSDDFNLLGEAFEKESKNDIVIGKVGNATTRVIKMKPLIDFGTNYFLNISKK